MNKESVLSQIYELTKIPFSIVNYSGRLEYVFPDEFRKVYDPEGFANPPDTLGRKGKYPDGVTIIEMYDGCQMSVAKIDENLYITTPPIGAASPERLPWGYLSHFIFDDKKEEYIKLLIDTPHVNITTLSKVILLVKSIFCDNISPDINYFRASDNNSEIIPVNMTGYSLCSKYTYSVITFIQDNIYENINMSDICSHVGLNRSSLSGYFKKDTGITISEYIKKRKS